MYYSFLFSAVHKKILALIWLNLLLAKPTSSGLPSRYHCIDFSAEGYWLLDDEEVCHLVNTQGPCGDNMIFYKNPNNSDKIHGFCDCFDARHEYFSSRNQNSECWRKFRSQVYVPEKNRCYPAFDQGPCPRGMWLILNDNMKPKCAKRNCPVLHSSQISENTYLERFMFYDERTGLCYETLTQGYCPTGHELQFSMHDWRPRCRHSSKGQRKCKWNYQPNPRSYCKPGSRMDYLSHYKCSKKLNPR